VAEGAPRLLDRVPVGAALGDTGAILDRFVGWAIDAGFEPYPAQEEAFLEIAAGRHVVLSTPTGSGKSLVALALHFKAMCEGKRSFYTAPIKALVSEKFFQLCEAFGAENVGMLTGDAAINWAAPIICCTQEVLTNMALRQGEACDAPYVVMDEFHYYADRDRGHAWQIPLLLLKDTTFLLMSATLGNTALIEEHLGDFTGREVAHVWSDHRPVPLDFEYRTSSIQETVEDLLDEGRAPVYIVNFTQRDAAETATALTSARVADKETRAAIAEAITDMRFDTPYGREMKRMLRHGVGLHHAGLLPKYRLLVEQLAQQGLLRAISGTDTLGVGVNIPIRTVVFTRLAKYDGEKVRRLQVREFMQIAGRAGRKGFDEMGSVVCQAPPDVIERKKREKSGKVKKGRGGRGKGASGGGDRKPVISWDEKYFRELTKRPPETLVSHLRINHGMLLQLLQRGEERPTPRGGYGELADLIGRSHERPKRKRRLRRDAAALFRSLRRAGIVHVADHRVKVDEELQRSFSLHQTLSPYLVDAIGALEPTSPNYAMQVVSCVEAVLEDPVVILRAQVRKLKDALMAKLKAQRVPYEERIAKLDDVRIDKPEADFLRATFRIYREHHPWVEEESIRPKNIAREMIEDYVDFADVVKRYGLQRSEGVLLRYLGQVLSTLDQSVPERAKNEELFEASAYLRDLVRRTDSSLLQEWESRTAAAAAPLPEAVRPPKRARDLATRPEALRARDRAEMHQIVRCVAEGDLEAATFEVRQEVGDAWNQDRLAEALAPFLEEHRAVRFDAEARRTDRTVIRETGPRQWIVQQALLDADDGDAWMIEGDVDLREETGEPLGPLVHLIAIRA
jgi:superfamily II RNA helicase